MPADSDVSIIIPAYNTEQYIEQALRSALDQTLQSIEVLLVDDASTDKTLDIARQFADDPRLRILTNPHNLGVSASRNHALAEATGTWVAVLDSDDWYAPERLAILLNIARLTSAEMVADNLHLIRDGEASPWGTLINEIGITLTHNQTISAADFIKIDRFGLLKPLFKRAFLKQYSIKYDSALSIAEDFWLDLECLIHGATFVVTPEPYYFYRSRQVSLVKQNRLKSLLQYCKKTEELLDQPLINCNPEISAILLENLKSFKRELAYQKVVDPIRRRKWLASIAAMVQNPYFFVHLFLKIPVIINRRIRYYILGDKSAFDILPKSKKAKSKLF